MCITKSCDALASLLVGEEQLIAVKVLTEEGTVDSSRSVSLGLTRSAAQAGR